MAEVGDQHNGGPSSGKAVLGTAREVDYLKVCHDALTDIWLLGDDTETGISWEEMFSKDPAAVVATCDFCASDRVNTFGLGTAADAEFDTKCQLIRSVPYLI